MNKKYYELNNGRLGQINLATSQVIHIHEDTNPELSLLGFNFLHVYNTKFSNTSKIILEVPIMFNDKKELQQELVPNKRLREKFSILKRVLKVIQFG